MRLVLIILTFLITVFSAIAQTADIDKYNKEKEQILNLIFSSVQFDSIYSSKRVLLLENELLSKDTPLNLKRKNRKVKIKNMKELRGKNYISIGDFTMDRDNPIAARVQIYSSCKNSILNLRLEKKDSLWVIVNHLIMED